MSTRLWQKHKAEGKTLTFIFFFSYFVHLSAHQTNNDKKVVAAAVYDDCCLQFLVFFGGKRESVAKKGEN